MKKIINGVLYNTDTAQLLVEYEKFAGDRLHYVREALYRKQNGEYFIYGEGGALTNYASYSAYNTFSGGSSIYPVDETEARSWAEEPSLPTSTLPFSAKLKNNSDLTGGIGATIPAPKMGNLKNFVDFYIF